MAFTSYASGASDHVFNFVDGVIIGAAPEFGRLCSLKHGKVSFTCHHSDWYITLIQMLEMVLFHASFVALKSRCPLTVNANPEDFRLSGEKILFQA